MRSAWRWIAAAGSTFRTPFLWVFALARARSAVAFPTQAAAGRPGEIIRPPDGEMVDDAVITATSTRFRATTDADGA